MLIELAIKNFAIIDDIKISFSEGLSVLTGETGAGKSIIIEAVNLLLGGRASSDLVRAGEKNAELEAFFHIELNSKPAHIMQQNGFEPSEGLIIRRVISLNGRHKIFINSKPSTIQILKLVTENIASISSQHAHQRLLNEDNHLDILDTFAGTWIERREINTIYNELIPLLRETAALKADIDKIAEENEFLKFQINEIEQAKIVPNEDEILETELNRLKNGSQLYETIQSSINEIYADDGSILEKLGMIRANLDKYGQIDKSLLFKAETLSKTIVELEDLTDGLRHILDTIDLDPDSLEEIEARLDLIQKLKRKYCNNRGTNNSSGSLEELFQKYEKLKEKISTTENIAEKIEDMEKRAALLSKDIGKKSLLLSEKRVKAALNLGGLAEKELQSLEMENTKFEVAIYQTAVDQTKDEIYDFMTVNGMKLYPAGIDKASFLISPNLGEPLRPINRIASGGELSRIVLALNVVLSQNESQDTLIFDEVDSGIGGRTSDKVGIKLQKLSNNYQVICITHLAQIAKYGSSHYKIEKKVINNRTSTSIIPLSDINSRVQEIARMMGGADISQATLDYAEEMLINTGIKEKPAKLVK